MPNKTFNNLPKEKQEAIIEVALKEFITHDYDSASLNQIINDIGIAKGSFYRYFDTKKDLYLFLIDYCINKKYEYLQDFFDDNSNGAMTVLRNIMYQYVKFNLDNSLYAIFLNKAYRNNDITRDELLFLRSGKEELIQAIKRLKEDGRIIASYDIDFILYCLTQILSGIGSYLKEKHGISNDVLIPMEKISEFGINQFFDQVINFLQNGLGVRTDDIETNNILSPLINKPK